MTFKRRFGAWLDRPAVVPSLIVALCGLLNWPFLLRGSLAELLETPDVRALIQGFYNTPHLWPDSLRWWHGAWMYPGIPRFRPVSCYLYWFECWIGLHWGWVWAGVVNFALFVACCLLTAQIVRQFTGSRRAALVAGSLGASVHFFNSHDAGWLIWFPNAYNLLTATLWLSALLAFDQWHTGAASGRRPRQLAASWGFFIAACLSLESAWVFPVMAVLVGALRPTTQSRRASLLQGALMGGAVLALAAYRATVVPSSTLPGGSSLNFGSIFFVTHPLVQTILLGDYWLLILSALIGLLLIREVRVRARQIARPIVWIIGAVVALAATFLLSPAAIIIAYRLAEDPLGYVWRMVQILAVPATLFLLWRYGPVLGRTLIAAFLFPVLAFLPTLPYIHAHWHYTFTPWFFLCILYGTLAYLVELHFNSATRAARQ